MNHTSNIVYVLNQDEIDSLLGFARSEEEILRETYEPVQIAWKRLQEAIYYRSQLIDRVGFKVAYRKYPLLEDLDRVIKNRQKEYDLILKLSLDPSDHEI